MCPAPSWRCTPTGSASCSWKAHRPTQRPSFGLFRTGLRYWRSALGGEGRGMGSRSLPQHLERPPAIRSPAVDGEVIVERSRTFQTKPLHDCERGSVDEGEILIVEGFTNGPGGHQVRGTHRLEGGNPPSKPLPKAFRSYPMDSPSKERPGLHQDMISGNQGIAPGKDFPGSAITRVGGIGRCIPDTRIDEEGQGASFAKARPSMSSFSLAISEPPEDPRLKRILGSGEGIGSPRSSATNRLTYSAKERPKPPALVRARWSISRSKESCVRVIIIPTS